MFDPNSDINISTDESTHQNSLDEGIFESVMSISERLRDLKQEEDFYK